MGQGVDWCSIGLDAPIPPLPRDSWDPIELRGVVDGIVAGDFEWPPPTLLHTAVGDAAFLYPGKNHVFVGEPESCKGWLATLACAQVLGQGGRVLYVDFEDTQETFARRLIGAGADPQAIIERAVYLRPDSRPSALAALLALGPFDIAVIDGVSEAYAAFGIDDWRDNALFLQTLPRPLADSGAAVVQIDHVVKSKEGRGRFAIGGQGKLSGVDVQYGVELRQRPRYSTPEVPGQDGHAVVTLLKDRPGGVAGGRYQEIARLDVLAADGPTKLLLTTIARDPDWLKNKVLALLEENEEKGCTANKMADRLNQEVSTVRLVCNDLADLPSSGVTADLSGQSIVYKIRGGLVP